jgi:hypothetical protein
MHAGARRSEVEHSSATFGWVVLVSDRTEDGKD